MVSKALATSWLCGSVYNSCMAPNAIVAKLNSLLADPIDSECKAVYLLCEVRKLLEPVPPPNRPFALNMYCHWALHVDLNCKGTISSFLKQVDDYVDRHLVGPEDASADQLMVQDFLGLDTLRGQFATSANLMASGRT